MRRETTNGLQPEVAKNERLVGFANALIGSWDQAMQRFLTECEYQARRTGLNPHEVYEALDRGYGFEVASEWDEWVKEE